MVTDVSASRRLVADSYDRVASAFAESADQRVYRFLAAPLVTRVGRCADTAAGVVLDVAAGTGAVGRQFPSTVATDISLEQLGYNTARRRVLADGERLPFRSDSFVAAVAGFGINHFADPTTLLAEMSRVAPVVGVTTWQRPDATFVPKQLVLDALASRAGGPRSPVGEALDRYGDEIGSVTAVEAALAAAGMAPNVVSVEVEVPWPGVDAYLDYRLTMPSVPEVDDAAEVRTELREALGALPPKSLIWRPRIIVGVGLR